MSHSLQQRYQIYDRDIWQRLAAYHGTRASGAFATWRKFTHPLAAAGLARRDIQNYAVR